jgi:hypothetical protein
VAEVTYVLLVGCVVRNWEVKGDADSATTSSSRLGRRNFRPPFTDTKQEKLSFTTFNFAPQQ